MLFFGIVYKNPSSNEKISYTLVLLINHDGNYLECGNYAGYVFDANTGISWHCDDDSITQISGLQKWVYIRKSHKNKKN